MKARIILAVTEQVSEYNYERHFKTVEVDIPENERFDIAKSDIVGGEWMNEYRKKVRWSKCQNSLICPARNTED